MTAKNGDNGYWQGYPSSLLSNNSAENCSSSHATPEFSSQLASNSFSSSEVYGHAGSFSDPVQAQAQRSETFQYQQVYVQSRNHVAAGLLAIFFGAFGIHKFYLGYNSTGITMLAVTVLGSFFTFGLAGMVMAVIGLVEGFIYLTTTQVAFDRTYVLNKKKWF